MRSVIARGMLVLGSCGILATTGCRSIQGKYVDPQAVRHGEDVGGVPVVVDRPRWLKVTHKRTNYVAYKVESSAAASAAPSAPPPAADPSAGGKPAVGASPSPAVGAVTTASVGNFSNFSRDS